MITQYTHIKKKILEKYNYIYIIGGGGKTTLMFSLADTAVSEFSKTVITGTTVKIFKPSYFFADNDRTRIFDYIKQNIKLFKHLTIAGADIAEHNKLGGLSPQIYDEIFYGKMADYVIIEADGSQGKSVKGHNEYEPVLSDKTQVTVIVAGLDIIEQKFSPDIVHRPEIFSAVTGIRPDEKISCEHIYRIITDDYMKKISEKSDVAIIFTKMLKTNDKIFELKNKLMKIPQIKIIEFAD
jgi:probable selenium-dependent hydroxylase accessory protein YqeC